MSKVQKTEIVPMRNTIYTVIALCAALISLPRLAQDDPKENPLSKSINIESIEDIIFSGDNATEEEKVVDEEQKITEDAKKTEEESVTNESESEGEVTEESGQSKEDEQEMATGPTEEQTEQAVSENPEDEKTSENEEFAKAESEEIDLEKNILAEGEEDFYRPRSRIDWEGLELGKFLSIRNWKAEQELKDNIPDWRLRLELLKNKEIIGLVLDCIGECRQYRGIGFSNAQYRSRIQEGDELTTLSGGHAWVYLLDGTLVRLSPNTSVIFKEINIEETRVFYHMRLNSGEVVWIGRKPEAPKETSLRETDSIFLPLAMADANFKIPERKVNESALFDLLDNDFKEVEKYNQLSLQMRFNNQGNPFLKTEFFVVFPNGTLNGEDASFHIVSLRGGKSYFKIRERTLASDEELKPIELHSRGYLNEEKNNPEIGKWFEIEERGREVTPFDEGEKMFGLSELVTARTPSIFMGRELLFENFGLPVLRQVQDRRKMLELGYYLWKPGVEGKESQLNERRRFITEYTRREETTGLLAAKKLKKRMAEKGETLPATEYSNEFYRDSLLSYKLNGENATQTIVDDREQLNSTKNKFWKYINNVKRK